MVRPTVKAPLLDRRQDFLLHHPLELPAIGGPAEQQGPHRDPIPRQSLQARGGCRWDLGKRMGLGLQQRLDLAWELGRRQGTFHGQGKGLAG